MIIREEDVVQDGLKVVFSGSRVYSSDRFIQKIKICIAAHDQYQLYLLSGSLRKSLQLLFWRNIEPLQHLISLVPVKIKIKIMKQVDDLRYFHPIAEIVLIRKIGEP